MKDRNEKLMNILANQRNIALNDLANIQTDAEIMLAEKNYLSAKLDNAFSMLTEIILSGQIPQQHVPSILEKNEHFKAFYESRLK